MEIEEIERILKSKKDKRLELYRNIVESQIKLDIKKELNRIYLNYNKGFMSFLLYRNKKVKENKMKALEILKNASSIHGFRELMLAISKDKLDEAIEELEVFIGNYQSINSKLDNTVTTMATIQNDNSSLVKILNKMGKEINDLKKEIRELKCRSCATCKHGFTHQFGDDIECRNFGADTQGIYFEKDFYCKNWESK